ncbi:MAG: helix-turn-helix domain-containing protein [candidate division NC10 bacterium]
MVPKDAMTAKEASKYLAMDEQTVVRMAAERRIPSLHHEGQWLFSRKSIDKWRIRQGARRAP